MGPASSELKLETRTDIDTLEAGLNQPCIGAAGINHSNEGMRSKFHACLKVRAQC